MERIEPIRRRQGSPWVEPLLAGQPVQRRDPGDEDARQRRKQRPPKDDGRPDADGHVDVSA